MSSIIKSDIRTDLEGGSSLSEIQKGYFIRVDKVDDEIIISRHLPPGNHKWLVKELKLINQHEAVLIEKLTIKAERINLDREGQQVYSNKELQANLPPEELRSFPIQLIAKTGWGHESFKYIAERGKRVSGAKGSFFMGDLRLIRSSEDKSLGVPLWVSSGQNCMLSIAQIIGILEQDLCFDALKADTEG